MVEYAEYQYIVRKRNKNTTNRFLKDKNQIEKIKSKKQINIISVENSFTERSAWSINFYLSENIFTHGKSTLSL